MRLTRLGILNSILMMFVCGSSLVSIQANAQTAFPDEVRNDPIEPPPEVFSRWRPGFQLGININKFSTNPEADIGSRLGYIGGLQLEYRVTRAFSAQLEVRATQKGFTYTTPGGITVDTRLIYLETPFLLKLAFAAEKKLHPYVLAGPNVGFYVGDNIELTQNGDQVSGPSISPQINTLDFAFDAGLGLEYQFAERMSGFILARASYGLINVSSLPGTDWKSRGFQVTFGGYFDF